MRHLKAPLLTIDVTDRTFERTNIDDILDDYLGGRGVGVKLAHDRIPFDADPYGPENRLFLATGPMQGSIMSFTGRMSATGLSPLTNGLASANAGGYLSRNFLSAGNSVVEITGASDELLALIVTDDGVRFEEVPDLEQATVFEVSEYMEEHFDITSDHLATIGPAGENGVRFASIMTYDHRAFGRGGLGAILGSKNVKTIAFDGDYESKLDLPDIQKLVDHEAATVDHPMKEMGTAFEVEWMNDDISLPTQYYERTEFEEGYQGISGERVKEKKYKKGACSQCAFACKVPTRDEETGLETDGPEYETVFAFGSNALVDDIVSVMKSNDLCDMYGMDTVSAGVTISAYLKANDEFGNSELIHELLEKIAYREGEGDLLAEGVGRVHDELGVKNWTMKNVEFAAHDGRMNWGLSLSYCVANRGADHMYSSMNLHDYLVAEEPESLEGKAPITIETENQKAINDSAVFCRFSRDYVVQTWEGEDKRERWEELLDASYDELMDVGHRIITLERHFNNQRGFDVEDDDTLPYEIPGIRDAIEEYYELRGWNEEGVVPETAVPQ